MKLKITESLKRLLGKKTKISQKTGVAAAMEMESLDSTIGDGKNIIMITCV